MSVSEVFQIPNQPTIGSVAWVPLGGDGVTAPIGYYEVDAQIVGDVSGGNASVSCAFDPRYTNLLAWVNIKIDDDTAAGEFHMDLVRSAGVTGINVVGTFPGVTEGFAALNSCYLWYPPPLFFAGDGRVRFNAVNVDATETYVMDLQVFAYDRDVRNRMNMTWLHQLIPSTNAPVAS